MGTMTDKAGLVAAAFSNFATKFNAAANKKGRTELAQNTKKLNGFTAAELKNQVDATVSQHVSGDNHSLTAAQVNIYTKSEHDAKLTTYPKKSVFPFLIFGDNSNTPPAVSGSFTGSSDGVIVDFAINLEEDGTVAVLRNGTNGSRNRTYISYITNALTAATPKVISTTKEFRPSNLPNNFDVEFVYGGNNVAIFAQLYDKTLLSSVGQDIAIFLPNKTFLADTMSYVRVAFNNMPNADWIRAGVVVSGYLYFVSVRHAPALDLRLWRIPINSFDGRTVVPEEVTNWKTTTPRKNAVSEPIVRIFDAQYSTDVAVNAAIHYDQSRGGSMSAINLFHNPPEVSMAAKDSRYIRLRVGMHTYIAAAHVGQSDSYYFTFSIVLDLQDKTAIMDSGPTGPVVIETNYDGAGHYAVKDSGYFKYGKQSILGNFHGNSPRDVSIQPIPGKQLTIVSDGEPDQARSFFRSSFVGAADKTAFECLKYGVTITNEGSASIIASYGSALGSKFYGVTPFGDNKLFLATTGRNANGLTERNIAKVVNDVSKPNYAYTLRNNSVLKGYGPSTDRSFLCDSLSAEMCYLYAHLVSEVSDSGYVVHGSYFTKDFYNHGLGDIDANGNEVVPGKRVNIDYSIFDQIFDAVIAKNNLDRSIIGNYTSSVFFPKCLPRGYAYLTWFVPSTRSAYFVLVELSIKTGTLDTKVTAVNVLKSSSIVTLRTDSATGVGLWFVEQTGGITIWKVGTEGYVIGFTTKSVTAVVGGAGSQVVRFFVDSYSNKPPEVLEPWDMTNVIADWSYPYLAVGIGFTAFRGFGFGQYHPADSYTKTIFKPYQNTKMGVMTSVPSTTASETVIATQELAEGWVVYFTNPNYALINGVEYTIPATSIDLRNVVSDPKNKTFYVYLKVVGQVISYDVVTTKVLDRYDYVKIGTVTTSNTGIATIEIKKLASFDNYNG